MGSLIQFLYTVNATTSMFIVVMYWIHVCRRFYESAFISIFSGTKMGFSIYLTGFGHYTVAPLCLLAHSPGFTGSNISGKGESNCLPKELLQHIYKLINI